MKKLFTMLVFLPIMSFSQVQYVSVLADVKNGIVGSDPTSNKPALDIIILAGATDKNGIAVEIGYENFQAIKFSKMYFGVGYTLIHWSKKLECVLSVEPTYITRDWGEYGKVTYTTIGASSRATYKLSDNLGVSALGNVLLREDNADRYSISTPKVYSFYIGIVYYFLNNY
jgi:hypothetical protein